MTARQLRKAAPGTTVVERDLVGRDVNKVIARYASFGWGALDMPAIRKTYLLTGGLFFHRHGITILFRKLAAEAVQPDLLPEPGLGAITEQRSTPAPERPQVRRVAALARS
jgi:hypothetical protein